MDYKKMQNEWIKGAPDDAAELNTLSPEEAEDRFYTELSFGTAGLRGVIGAGTNRMNVHVVRRATQGLCDYLKHLGRGDEPVVVAYDSRLYSDVFALETALVCAKNGVRAYLFESLRAVPQLSFAVRHLNCAAGVMITASHNPAQYNGYKVYWSHGGQLGPKEAAAVLDFISRIGYFDVVPAKRADAEKNGLLKLVGKEIDEAYYAATETLLLNPQMLKKHGGDINIVYTALHGAGNVPVRALLQRVGVTNVSVVDEQSEPDASFKTVRVPNPEDADAFRLAFKLADEVKADTVLATDPDSDRLGVASRGGDGEFMLLTGNQIGCLLMEYMLSSLNKDGRVPDNAFMAKSMTSTRLADAICESYGVRLDTVLIGFRFISEKIDEAARTGENTFLFGFEESNGFLAGGFSRDKDAIGAAMLMAEASTHYALSGMTLIDALEEIYEKYGYYKEISRSHTLYGKTGMGKITRAMSSLREKPIESLHGVKTACFEDYMTSTGISLMDNGSYTIALPKTNMLRFLLEDGSWCIVRPSGTEPKLKLYIGTKAQTKAAADALASGLLEDLDVEIDKRLNNS